MNNLWIMIVCLTILGCATSRQVELPSSAAIEKQDCFELTKNKKYCVNNYHSKDVFLVGVDSRHAKIRAKYVPFFKAFIALTRALNSDFEKRPEHLTARKYVIHSYNMMTLKLINFKRRASPEMTTFYDQQIIRYQKLIMNYEASSEPIDIPSFRAEILNKSIETLDGILSDGIF